MHRPRGRRWCWSTPEGYVVAQYAGEGHAHAIDALVAELREEHRAKGTLQPGDLPYVSPTAASNDPCFPATAIAVAGKGFLVADTGHHRVVELAGDAETVIRRFGSGERVLVEARRTRPGSTNRTALCPLPDDVTAEVGYDVVVADTVNHALRGVRQLWTFGPRTGVVEVAAGTTNEGLLDGSLGEAWFAQTSGLAAAGDRLWLADNDTSSLRFVEAGSVGGTVHTAVGAGLFDFGFRDGDAREALLKHPLGGIALPDGSVAGCDTYNGAVRRIADSQVTTIAGGPLRLVVDFEPPPGQKVDDRFGPATQLPVSATPPGLIRGGDGRGTELSRMIDIDAAACDGVLQVAARAASCDESGGEGAACYLHRQDWGVPVQVLDGGVSELVLPLSGRA